MKTLDVFLGQCLWGQLTTGREHGAVFILTHLGCADTGVSALEAG